MPRTPQMAIILSTYQRPDHLRRSLLSLSLQVGAQGEFEVVVTDDGSDDATADIVADFSRSADFPIRFVTQRHLGFRLARCRNNGVRASSSPYLLFSDSDCLFPVDHVQQHLRVRRKGVVRSGNSYRFDRQTTDRIDDAAIRSGEYRAWVSAADRRWMRQRSLKDNIYGMLSHSSRPKLVGCNIAIFRHDFELVNGFDERFIGWGCEDDDLAVRLRWAGVRIKSILHRTRVYHLWHPRDPSRPAEWNMGANVAYLRRSDKPIRCIAGYATLGENDEVRWDFHSQGMDSGPVRKRRTA